MNISSSDQFDSLSKEEENELEAMEKKITKVKAIVWDETNYEASNHMWKLTIQKSKFYDVLQYLE